MKTPGIIKASTTRSKDGKIVLQKVITREEIWPRLCFFLELTDGKFHHIHYTFTTWTWEDDKEVGIYRLDEDKLPEGIEFIIERREELWHAE